MRVGIVGCGVISHQYVENAAAFDSFDIVACADQDMRQAESLGKPVLGVDDLLADSSIDVVLNLTPASAHATVTRGALAAGKHVYTEKPLATELSDAAELLAEADRRELRIGCAPDTFLSGAFQAARAVIDDGGIGKPLSVRATVLTGGIESWHPNPGIFFVDGAGPLLDMAPYYVSAIVALLGPITRVSGFATTHRIERQIEIGPRAGERFRVSTPTHTAASLELATGASGTLIASFESASTQVCDLTIYGVEGALALPDPNSFGGPLRLKHGTDDWTEVPFHSRGARDARGVGLHDMIESIAAGRPHRATGALGLHVVEVARGILRSAAEGRVIELASKPTQPAPLPVDALA